MNELGWFLFGGWVGASLMSVAFVIIDLKLRDPNSTNERSI